MAHYAYCFYDTDASKNAVKEQVLLDYADSGAFKKENFDSFKIEVDAAFYKARLNNGTYAAKLGGTQFSFTNITLTKSKYLGIGTIKRVFKKDGKRSELHSYLPHNEVDASFKTVIENAGFGRS